MNKYLKKEEKRPRFKPAHLSFDMDKKQKNNDHIIVGVLIVLLFIVTVAMYIYMGFRG